MPGDNPRDMPEWMRKVDRQLRNNSRAALRGLAEVRDAVGTIDSELGGIKDTIDNLPAGIGTPAAPVELTGQSALYVDEKGRPLARVSIDFPDVVRTTTGQPITVLGYELEGYEQTATLLQDSRASYPGRIYPGSTYPGTPRDTKGLPPTWVPLASSPTSNFVKLGLPQGQVWVFRVRAVGGEWSQALRIETLRDTTPPPQPTAPVVEASRGTLVVRWDGLAVTGPQPSDFETAVLVGGPDPSPGAERELYRFGTEGGTFVMPGVDYYETWFFRLRTMDQSGNWSVWSEQASGYPTPMVDADIILTELDAARTHLKNIDAGVSILPDTIITEHLHVTESMSAAVGQFLRVKADMLEANDIWADSAWLGYAEARLVKADMFVGKEFEGGTFTGSTFRSGVTGARTELTKDGLRQVDGLGRELVKIGYGIETGMALRNPGTGDMTPISKMVFGVQRYGEQELADFNGGFPGIGVSYPASGPYDGPNWGASQVTKTFPVGYVAQSSTVLLNCSAEAYINSDLYAGEFVTPGVGRCWVFLRRRNPPAFDFTRSSTAAGWLHVWDSYLVGALGTNASTSWMQQIDNLEPGAVYDLEVTVHYDRSPRTYIRESNGYLSGLRNINGAHRLVVSPEIVITPR